MTIYESGGTGWPQATSQEDADTLAATYLIGNRYLSDQEIAAEQDRWLAQAEEWSRWNGQEAG